MVTVEPGRHDFGLNFKKNGQYCLLGYIRKVVDTYGGRGNNNYDNKNGNNNGNGNGNNGSGNNNGNEKDKLPPKIISAWGTGDSVQVVGSTNSDKNVQAESVQWEYSSKALSLLLEYQSKFPLMFERLDSLPHQMKYQAEELFCQGPGSGGRDGGKLDYTKRAAVATAACKDVNDWMKAQPFFSMARTPLSTISLSK